MGRKREVGRKERQVDINRKWRRPTDAVENGCYEPARRLIKIHLYYTKKKRVKDKAPQAALQMIFSLFLVVIIILLVFLLKKRETQQNNLSFIKIRFFQLIFNAAYQAMNDFESVIDTNQLNSRLNNYCLYWYRTGINTCTVAYFLINQFKTFNTTTSMLQLYFTLSLFLGNRIIAKIFRMSRKIRVYLHRNMYILNLHIITNTSVVLQVSSFSTKYLIRIKYITSL